MADGHPFFRQIVVLQ